MNIVLTGANGFIGNYFLRRYGNVHIIHPFSFLANDLETLELQGIDAVIHLSALVHQMGGASPDEYQRINVHQTLDLARKAKLAGVPHFIFMSTVKVYGEENDTPYTETSLCRPIDDYGKSKFRAEQELLALEDASFKISIIRTPIVYGHGVKANIRNLLSLVRISPFLPFGKIQNRRSMVYIGNLCHLVNEIVLQGQNGIFLAADDTPLSTSDFIKIISNKLHKKLYLVRIPFFATALKTLKPSFYQRLYGNLELDNTLTKEKLQLSNPYTTEAGIDAMIFREKELR